MPMESDADKIRRYETTLKAIKDSTLPPIDFGDWVQAVCEEVLDGLWPECPNCGTDLHEGACVSDEEAA